MGFGPRESQDLNVVCFQRKAPKRQGRVANLRSPLVLVHDDCQNKTKGEVKLISQRLLLTDGTPYTFS